MNLAKLTLHFLCAVHFFEPGDSPANTVHVVTAVVELKVQWGSEIDGEGGTGWWVLLRPDSVEVQGWGTHWTQIPGVWGWVVYKPVDGYVIEGLLGGSQHEQNENLGCLGKSPVLGTGLNTGACSESHNSVKWYVSVNWGQRDLPKVT